ncbi:MAG: YbaB/EbfC family nucleoid-associated protein [Caldilineaceae bacterium]
MSKGKKPGGRPGLPPMGGMNNMGGLMAKMNKLQDEMAKAELALAEEEVTASSGGGMVSVAVTGQQQVKSITIQPEAVTPEDVEMLQDMVVAAVNEALEKSRALKDERMGALTGGLNLPPGLGF